MALSRTLSEHRTVPASGRLFLSLLERIQVGHLVLITPDGQPRVSAILTRRRVRGWSCATGELAARFYAKAYRLCRERADRCA